MRLLLLRNSASERGWRWCDDKPTSRLFALNRATVPPSLDATQSTASESEAHQEIITSNISLPEISHPSQSSHSNPQPKPSLQSHPPSPERTNEIRPLSLRDIKSTSHKQAKLVTIRSVDPTFVWNLVPDSVLTSHSALGCRCFCAAGQLRHIGS